MPSGRSVASATSRKKRSMSALRRADIGGRRQDGAVGAVVLGEADVGDGRLGVVAGAAEEDRHARRSSSSRVSTMILLLLLRGEHRGLAGRAHDQHCADVPLSSWNLSRVRKRGEIHRAVLVERGDQGNERAGQQLRSTSSCLHFQFPQSQRIVSCDWSVAIGGESRGGDTPPPAAAGHPSARSRSVRVSALGALGQPATCRYPGWSTLGLPCRSGSPAASAGSNQAPVAMIATPRHHAGDRPPRRRGSAAAIVEHADHVAGR